MTLKQFGYLAGGLLLAYFLYKFPLPSIITFPLAGITALAGIAFAFVPIQERPLDRWLIAFIKSIYSPTQFLWRKNNPPLALLLQPVGKPITLVPTQQSINHQIANQKLNAYLSSLPQTLDTTVNIREKAYLTKTLSLFNASNTPVSSSFIPPMQPSADTPSANAEKIPSPVSQVQLTPVGISPTIPNQPLTPPPNPILLSSADTTPVPPAITPSTTEIQKEAGDTNSPSNLQKKINELMEEKERLARELSALQKKAPPEETSPPVIPQQAAPVVKIPPSPSPSSIQDTVGMPTIPTIGNIILGIVRDNLKRLLPGIIITVKDLSGMPMRAFKTNKLGQFAAATPLTNGHYIIEIEDPLKRFQFDQIEVILDGSIFRPIEIIAKGNREILRDKLNKELFGRNSI